MTSIADYYNSLRNYQFLDYHKAGVAEQMKMHQQTDLSSMDKFKNVCWYNAEAIVRVGFDVGTYLTLISLLRPIGLCHPVPPAPPEFPTPHSNVELMDYAVRRALWNWGQSAQKEILEGIADNYSDRWNVFQLVGEWSFAFALENAHKSSYYKSNPTFLTIAEELDNGATYRTISKDFNSLWAKDKTAVLEALYRQAPCSSLSSSAKQVYQNIRAFASQLHQGNQNYLQSFNEYSKTLGAQATAPTPVRPKPQITEREIHFLKDVDFMRKACLDALNRLPTNQRKTALEWITTNGRNHPGYDPKGLVAYLTLLHVMKEGYKNNRLAQTPGFILYDTTLLNGKSMREVGVGFAVMPDRDFANLQQVACDPNQYLPYSLQEKHRELSEFASYLTGNRAFIEAYDALRIDLLVGDDSSSSY